NQLSRCRYGPDARLLQGCMQERAAGPLLVARHRQPHALLLPFRTLARVRLPTPTSAAARPAVAPIVSAQRGPNTSAIWPTTGQPNGAPPRKAATRSAVTRPRTAAWVEVCMKVLLALRTVIADAPIGTSATANSQ